MATPRPPRITNQQIMDRLGEVVEALSHQPPPETSWQGFREEMRIELVGINAKMDALTMAQKQHAEVCPYRDDIRRGANNLKRMDEMSAAITDVKDGKHGMRELWDALWNLRLDASKWGGASGGLLGLLSAIAYNVGRAAKWWP